MGSHRPHRVGRTRTRRDFLKTAAASLGAVCAPMIVPASVLGVNAPSNRIGVGFVGCGNQSTIDLPAFLGHDDCQVLAVCDVNTASHGYKSPDQFLGRQPAQEQVNAHYAKHTTSGTYKGCDAYEDFREVLARDDIDAVTCVVPDHWHALITVMAARGQGHLLRKALVAHHRAWTSDGQGGPRPPAHVADGQPLPIEPGQSARLRAGAQRPDRNGPADSHSGGGDQRRRTRSRLAAHARARGIQLRNVARPCSGRAVP